VASSANVELRALAPGFENSGAGGSGLCELPPYLEDGVPGLGLPLRSAGSNRMFVGGGGLPSSEDPRDGVHECMEDPRPLGEKRS
jgi:hypothetical protein